MKKNGFLSFCLAGSLAVSTVMTSYGALGPGDALKSIPEGVSEETWSRLNDQTIEFDELYDLVRYFNPDLLSDINLNEGISSLDDLEVMYEEMRLQIPELNKMVRDLKDAGMEEYPDKESDIYQGYVDLKTAAKGLEESAKKSKTGMKSGKKRLDAGADQMAKSYTAIVSQMMIGYDSVQASRSLLQKMVEASQAAYDAQNLRFQQGMATEAEVLAANKELLSARSALQQLDHTGDSLKSSLALMTGYPADSLPQISSIPQVDPASLTALDLEGDTQKAINNNYGLIGQRRAKSDGTTTGVNMKEADLSRATQEVSVQMESMYQAVMQAKAAYDASCTSYEKAVLINGKSDRAFQLGMMSRVAYLQSQMALLQAEGAKQSAYNSLYQAYDTYQWAVRGIILQSGQ
ncbi:TolC family protein [Lacrimispora sp.]|uniref:TolC family protein n=1 Tax=Lacrimispora sp. TaxID=2719234 RepID=UPI003460CCDF